MYSLITLITDYGSGSPYVAAIKGKVYSSIDNVQLIEITNEIETFDISTAAFLLNASYQNFKKGSWHIIGIDTNISLHKQFLIAEKDGHYFIGADNGIFSILFEEANDVKVYKINERLYSENELFADKNVFVPLIASFLKQGNLEGLAEPSLILTKKQSIQPVVEENLIRGTVMYLDGFHNAITNINRALFEKVVGNKSFELYYYGKHHINKLSKHYHEWKAGDDLLLFNENNYLEISMNKGKGAQLLGLKIGSKVTLEVIDTAQSKTIELFP